MRTLALAALTMVTALASGAADAQRIGGAGAPYPAPGLHPMQQPGSPPPPMTRPAPMQGYPARPVPAQGYPNQPGPMHGYPNRPYPGQSYPNSRAVQTGGSRWGGSIGGRWYGGSNAPGGWNAYRRPNRGWQVPSYWNSPNFYIGDYAGYGLFAPPQGYYWQRYYDDAVLIDSRGRVSDSRAGIDWDGGSAYADGGAGGYGSSDYASTDYGYSDSSESEAGYAGRPPYQPVPRVTRNGAVTTYQTGGYTSGYGYATPGTTTTVITIQPAETVTTTTTEYVEETRYAAPRRVYHAPKRVWRAKPKCSCKRVVRYVERPIQGS